MLAGQSSKILLKDIININIRKYCSTSAEDLLPLSQYVYNRNPRNLEKLRIAYKPAGYHLEKPGREFWHKYECKVLLFNCTLNNFCYVCWKLVFVFRLQITTSKRHVTASVLHHTGMVPVLATTAEWAIRKQLFRLAYFNVLNFSF